MPPSRDSLVVYRRWRRPTSSILEIRFMSLKGAKFASSINDSAMQASTEARSPQSCTRESIAYLYGVGIELFIVEPEDMILAVEISSAAIACIPGFRPKSCVLNVGRCQVGVGAGSCG